MQVIEWQQFIEKPSLLGRKPSAVTIGVFDGVHLGHKLLIETIVSHNGGLEPLVVAFRQSRHKKTRGPNYPGDISTFRQKIAAFESLGVSKTVVVEFTESLRHMAGTEFLELLIERGNMCFLTVGSNFRCGYQLDTDAQKISEFSARRGISVNITRPLTTGGKVISSTHIRAAIANRDFNTAALMLGRPFALDFSGVPVTVKGRDFWYDFSGISRVLPPSAVYRVTLTTTEKGAPEKKTAEILIQDRAIRVSGESEESSVSLEYAEFLQ